MFKAFFCLGSLLFFMKDGFSETGPVGFFQNWSVVSDEYDESIDSGTFVIQGTVKMFSSAAPLEDVLIQASPSKHEANTDSLGRFSVKGISGQDQILYIFKRGWSEIVIEGYEFRDQHRITLSAYLHQDTDAVKRKPVIYLYSDREREVYVQLDPKGEFTFTYPRYQEGWKVKVTESGQITDLASAKTVPYLFWEAKSKGLFYYQENGSIPGYLIQTDTVIDFLENKLTLLGLNETEQTDFITYWGPVLQQKQYALIQFLVDSEYTNLVAALSIDPVPDAIRRVFMICSPLDDTAIGMPVKEPELKKFERNGFTVVEWGGTSIDLSNLKPN